MSTNPAVEVINDIRAAAEEGEGIAITLTAAEVKQLAARLTELCGISFRANAVRTGAQVAGVDDAMNYILEEALA